MPDVPEGPSHLPGRRLLAASLLAAAAFLASLAASQNDPGSPLTAGSFSVTPPSGGGWRIEQTTDRILMTRERTSAGHRIGTTALLVLRTRPPAGDCGLSADQTASDYCDQEELELWAAGQVTGLFGVMGLERGTVTLGDKRLHAMRYVLEFSPERGGARTENRMYLYFPPSFEQDDHFFVFMQTEACLPHHCDEATGGMDESPLREVIGSLRLAGAETPEAVP